MTGLQFTLENLPPNLMRWTVSRLRARTVSPGQVASQFYPSETDPRRRVVIEGLRELSNMPEAKLPECVR